MNKQHFFKIILLTCLLGYSSTVFSQTTINAANNSAVINGNTFEYSIGEMTLVSTERNNNLIITQGYLQPQQLSSHQDNSSHSTLSDLTDKIKVYPNPTENILFIESSEALAGTITYQLLDASGKIILRKNENQVAGNNKYSLDLSSLAAGSYFLLLHKANTESTVNDLSFKIVKVN